MPEEEKHATRGIVYLTYDGLTDPLGQAQILPYIIGLSNLGYDFTIVSFEKKNAFSKYSLSIHELCSKHKLSWVPLVYHKNPPVLSTLYDLWILLRTVKRIIRNKPIHILHCRSYLTSMIGLSIKKKYGVKFIFDMRGFWADERVEGGLWNLRNPIYKIIYQFFKKQEKKFWSTADAIISLTESARQVLRQASVKTAITVIPTCVDLKHFSRDAHDVKQSVAVREQLGISKNDFVLVYSGSWGTWYLTNEMVKFFEFVQQLNPNAWFLILSQDEPDIQSASTNKIKHHFVSRQEMPVWLAMADASVFFIKPSFSKKASSATKLGELLAMKLPVVTNGGWGDIQDFDGNGVIVLSQLDDENFRRGATWATAPHKPITESALERLSLQFGVQEYHHVYQNLMD